MEYIGGWCPMAGSKVAEPGVDYPSAHSLGPSAPPKMLPAQAMARNIPPAGPVS